MVSSEKRERERENQESWRKAPSGRDPTSREAGKGSLLGAVGGGGTPKASTDAAIPSNGAKLSALGPETD